MSTERNVYDPYEAQLETLRGLDLPQLDVDGLCTPAAVQMLVAQWSVSLVELKGRREELVEVRAENGRLADERNRLEVRLARLDSREALSWIEIIVGALFGFAGNMLVVNPRDHLGWVLVIVSVAIFVVSRLREVLRKEQKHAED